MNEPIQYERYWGHQNSVWSLVYSLTRYDFPLSFEVLLVSNQVIIFCYHPLLYYAHSNRPPTCLFDSAQPVSMSLMYPVSSRLDKVAQTSLYP